MINKVSSVVLELDPLKAKAAKDRRVYRLNVVEMPVLRIIGFTLLGMLVWLHNVYILGTTPWGETGRFLVLALIYAFLSWVVLRLWFKKVKRVHLGTLFLTIDILVWIAAIYYSGGENSLLFFILFIRIADQTNTTFRKALFFTHATVLAYLFFLFYLSVVEGREIPWPQETIKLLVLYCANIYVSLTARTAERIRNRTTASMVLARDLVGQLKKKTEDLDQAKARAEEANRAKSEFLANMSHELRTPLNHIIGFTELTLDKNCGDLNETQEEYLKDVLHSSHHLLSIINDILDLSKVETGKMELILGEVDLLKVLEGSLSMVREKGMKHGIAIKLEADGIPEVANVDERKLKQVMFNLLSNAVKFTQNGGAVHVRTRPLHYVDGRLRDREGVEVVSGGMNHGGLAREGEYIEISVQDTGIGIKREDLTRIFEPFEQGENTMSRRYPGTGLGLSLTRTLVELHGGRIWAESKGEGRGSTFRFVLPMLLGKVSGLRG